MTQVIHFVRRNSVAFVVATLVIIMLIALIGARFSLIASATHGGEWHTTERVSVDSSGNEINANSYEPAINDTGRFVTFYSSSEALVPNDTNNTRDVFLYDREQDTVERISVSGEGVEGDGGSILSALSGDGSIVVFHSMATNLVVGDTNAAGDIFIRDRQLGTTERVNVDSDGNQVSVGAFNPVISSDGRYTAFVSASADLVLNDTNEQQDIFIHDRQTGITERVNVDSSGNEAVGGGSINPSISADGRYVSFESRAENLVSGDTNGQWDIFVHDRQTGATERVNVDSDGNQATDRGSFNAWISGDGGYVVFSSVSGMLVSGDTNNEVDIFIRDRFGATTERVSVDSGSNQAIGAGYRVSTPSVSINGRYVAFRSEATNLVVGDTNSSFDIFIRDRQLGTTERVNMDSDGNQADGDAANQAMSGNGLVVAFQSGAGNLVGNDTNAKQDIFVADRTILPNNPPTTSNEKQFKADGITEIEEGDTTNESTVVFKANVTDPDEDDVKLQIELRRIEEYGSEFFNTLTAESEPVTSGSEATIQVSGLIEGTYHWQYRAIDSGLNVSPWVEFGIPGVDFRVDLVQEIKVAVILAETKDADMAANTKDRILNDDPTATDDIDSRLRSYFCENSFGDYDEPSDTCLGGLINIELEIIDNNGQPFELDKDMQHYGEDVAASHLIGTDANNKNIISDYKDRSAKLIWDAINEANDSSVVPDFNLYDAVVVVHEGRAQESVLGALDTNRPGTFAWPVEFAVTANPNEEVARNWMLIAEAWDVGAWAHELAHTLGEIVNDKYLCDLYPYGLGCAQDTVGDWDLMGSGGPHLGENPKGSRPSNLSSYHKIDLGWFGKQVVIPGSFTVTGLTDMDFGDKVKTIALNQGDYYLVEARTTNPAYTDWDLEIPEDEALVIYHVVETQWEETVYPEQVKELVDRAIVNQVGLVTNQIPNLAFVDEKNNVLIDASSFNNDAEFTVSATYDTDFGIWARRIGYSRPDNKIISKARTGERPLEVPSGDLVVGPSKIPQEARKQGMIEAFKVSITLEKEFGYLLYATLVFFIGLLVFGVRLVKSDERTLLTWVAFLVLLVVTTALFFGYVRSFRDYAKERTEVWELRLLGNWGYPGGPLQVPDGTVGGATPDIDLHAYDDLGNHVGVNYETGEYEINIPNATASGDLLYAEEWISVPEGTNVTFEVSTNDITQFFAENPDIEASLASTEETYTFGAVTYDAVSQRYESAPVENITINPGETRVHTIGGTTEEPTVDEGVVVVELEPTADTYLKNGHKNKNFGSEATTWIRGSGKRKTLVQFDQQAINDAVGTGTLINATLELEAINGTAGSWTSNGKLVGAYRLTRPWTELGATWNCGNDIDTTDSSPDCTGETWEMNQSSTFSWVEPPLDQVLFTNDTTGTISWDVTQDVADFIATTATNYGWVIRKDKDGAQGRIEFYSRETLAPPRLILNFTR